MRGSGDRQPSSAVGNVGASGRVHEGERHRGQPGGDTVSACLDRAGTGEVEEEPILVLCDLRCHLAEGEHHRGGLGVGARRVWQRVRAEGMVQHLGRTREQQAHGVGEAGRRGRAVTLQRTLHRLDRVFTIPAGAIEVFVQHLGWGGRKRGDATAWMIPCAHDCRLAPHPPGAGPRRLAQLLIATAPRREPLTRGRCQSGSLLMPMARVLEEGFRVTEQDGVASEAKDTIGQASGGDHVHALGGRDMAVAADEARGVGPALTQVRQETGQNPSMLRACGACPGPAGRCAQRRSRSLKAKEGQSVRTLVVRVIEGECLLARRAVIGVIEGKHDGRGGLCVAGPKVVHEGRGETREVLAVHVVLKARERGSPGQVLRGLQRKPLHSQLAQGVTPEALGSVAIGIAGGALVETLRAELPEGIVDGGRRPLIMDGRRKVFGATNLAIDPAQQERTNIRR